MATNAKAPESAAQIIKLVHGMPDNVIYRNNKTVNPEFVTAWAEAVAKQTEAIKGTNLVIASVASKKRDDFDRLRKAVISAKANARFEVPKAPADKANLTPVSIDLPGGGTLTPVLRDR